MINGIINVYKEKGYTSHDVVARLRGIAGQKKIGHTGTLDPDAEGVLPVCLGNATKVCGLLTDKDKVYQSTLLLGTETDTQDTSGTIRQQKEVTVTPEAVRACILSFVGAYQQIPPMYSAKKVNGKKLYELARQGLEIEREPRLVQIFAVEIQEIALPRVRFAVTCSKGTYIRTLCHDIGVKLGCGGCMETLLRTKVDRFRLKESYRLDQIEQISKEKGLAGLLYPVDKLFDQYPQVTVKETFAKLIYNGNAFYPNQTSEEIRADIVRVYDHKHVFAGIYEYSEAKNRYEPKKMFLS